MSFDEALAELGITEFKSRIWNSSSSGELFFLADYIFLAEQKKLGAFGDAQCSTINFRSSFRAVAQFAEENWTRPESCFQHMPKLIGDYIKILAASE